ncbi:hypothetical protein K491DRAFT_716217 [Lophiostoma macrostomum CBS 122681]|uniref:Uncharacterized protein n=1 Tax=Lophiostoma macrostomum CBS 122681 TaxID=1314788 RepID=A0A6A6T784_9PLEO|nr:hypothetical protein K491DRAFT_716217 [Lophiostoma macrostomum CBS 122681]
MRSHRALSRSPIRGGNDQDGFHHFEFPASDHAQGDRRDSIARRGSWGTLEGSPGPTLYPQSFGAHSQVSLENPFLDTNGHADETSRGHRLRRSTNNLPLRGSLASSSRSAARSSTRLPRSTTAPNLHTRLERIQESQSSPNVGGSFLNPMRMSNRDSIARWQYTATTLDQGLVHSPITPRPFNEKETHSLDARLFGSHEDVTLGPNQSASQVHGRSASTRPLNRLSPAHMDDIVMSGPAFAALVDKHRAQQSIFPDRGANLLSGLDPKYKAAHPPAVGPVLSPSPKTKPLGDPYKKPPSITLDEQLSRHALGPPPPEDAQTYTAAGLLAVLAKVYAPGDVPEPVRAAMPPYGHVKSSAEHFGAQTVYNGDGGRQAVSQKEREYLSHFIDTLLAKQAALESEKAGWEAEKAEYEEALEDKEVDKAHLTTDISAHYDQARANLAYAKSLERFTRHLVQKLAHDDALAIVGVAASLDLNLATIMSNSDAEHVLMQAERRSHRNTSDVKYWKGRWEEACVHARNLETEAVRHWRARALAAEKVLDET